MISRFMKINIRNLKLNLHSFSKSLLNFKFSTKPCGSQEIVKDVKFHVSGINYDEVKGTKKGDDAHYIISFECKKCNTRNTKMCTHKAYHTGLVLIRCDGCGSHHLIADNLGWILENEKKNIEQIKEEYGESVKKLDLVDMLNMETNKKSQSNTNEPIHHIKDSNMAIIENNSDDKQKPINNKATKYKY